MKIAHQHGDLLLEKVDSVPENALEIPAVAGFVLERGEGVHTHVLEDVEGVRIFDKGGDIYVSVDIQARINHEEHGIQVLSPGIYRKKIERFFDYETMESKKVVD